MKHDDVQVIVDGQLAQLIPHDVEDDNDPTSEAAHTLVLNLTKDSVMNLYLSRGEIVADPDQAIYMTYIGELISEMSL